MFAVESRPAAGADLTSSLTIRSQEKGGRARGERRARLRIKIRSAARGPVAPVWLLAGVVACAQPAIKTVNVIWPALPK